MKKILAMAVLAGALIATPSNAQVSGSLPAADDPFWLVARQLHDPLDPDCYDKALAIYGSSYGAAAHDVSVGVCSGLEQIANMETVLLEEGIETNLFDDEDDNGEFDQDWRTFNNLYFEKVNIGRIEFTTQINFMNHDFLTFVSQLSERMGMEQNYIALDADIVNGLADYGARLTMYNVSDFEDPEILVNGMEDTEGVVSNITYDRETHTITCDTSHFSNFQAVEKNYEKARVSSWDAEKYMKPGTGCEERLKVTIKGKKFDKDAEVRIGNKKAYDVDRKSSKKIVARFCYEDLMKIKTDTKRTVTVVNPGNRKTEAGKQIHLKDYLMSLIGA